MRSEPYALDFTKAALKDLKTLRHNAKPTMRALERLREDPAAGHTLAGVLQGARSLEFTVRGSGAFRAIYKIIDERHVCLIMLVGPHENIYKEAERRIKALRRAGEI